MESLKKLKVLGSLLIITALIIGGCGKRSANAPRDNPVISTETENAGGSLEHGDGFGFDIFELEIDFDEHDTISIDYNVTKYAEADFENTFENFDLEGAEAMNKIDELFTYLLLTKDMPEEEVMTRILQFFNLKGYSKFELDVNFDEGTKLRINDVK